MKLKLLYISLWISLFSGIAQTASANFDFNENCRQAYTLLFEFKFNAAKQRIQQEKNSNPNNGIILLLENYSDFLYLIRAESKSTFESLEKNKDKRLQQLQTQDKNSPYYLFCQAEINFQWGILRGRLGSYLGAAREINRAYKLLEQNHRKYPDFHPNLKGIGFINVVLGALPDGFLKSTLSSFGISGNTQKGLQYLAQLADNLPKSSYAHYYEEVVYLYSFLLSDVLLNPEAYPKTMYYTAKFSDSSILKTYLRAYISIKEKHNDQAIQVLKNQPKGNQYLPFPIFNYMMGVALLNKLDLSAETYFKAYLQDNKGDNYIKDTHLRLAWIKLLKGDTEGSNQQRELVRKNGFTFQEKDKQAAFEATEAPPHPELLKARLLYDGGYDAKALQTLANIHSSTLTTTVNQVEFHYRLGRIYESLDKADLALTAYQKTFDQGKNLTQHYAAKAGLQMGKIYEMKKDWNRARSMYTGVLNLPNHQYKLSIETEAKKNLGKLPKK